MARPSPGVTVWITEVIKERLGTGSNAKIGTTPKRILQSSRILVSRVKPVAQRSKRTGTKSHGVGCKKTSIIIGGIIATSSLSPWIKVKRLDEGSKCSKEGARSGTKIKTQKEFVIIKFINFNKSKRKNVVQALAYMNTFSRDIYVLYQNPK